MSRGIRPPWQLGGERGTTTLELALVLPLLIALVLGALDFGQAIVMSNMASEAAREGARAGQVLVPANSTPTAAPVVTAGQTSSITTAARRQAGPFGLRLTVTPTGGYDSAGQFVRVAVSASYTPIARQFLRVSSVTTTASSKLYLP
jgi:Flp pilus assembly protein TadG